MWTIEPLFLHRVRVPGPEVLFQRAFGDMIEIGIHAFLLRSEDKVCLVDTGLAPDYALLNANVRARKGPESGFFDVGLPVDAQLRALGIEPDVLVLTSFGPYATGRLDAWPYCPLWVSARGCADLLQPEEPALFHAPAPEVRDRVLAAHRVKGVQEIFPGLSVQEVGVHHAASMVIQVDTAHGVMGIADPVFVPRNLHDGIALGVAEHVAQWHRMVRQLGLHCDALIPIHALDPVPVPRLQWHASFGAESVP